MSKLVDLIKKAQAGAGLQVVAGLGAATFIVLLAAIVGLFALGGKSDKKSGKVATKGSSTESTVGTYSTLPTDTTATTIINGQTFVVGPGGKLTAVSPGGSTATTARAGSNTSGTLASTAGATRIGVSTTGIEYGLHAPKTDKGAPWGLADPVLEGVGIYQDVINAAKVNGRTLHQNFCDDQYTVDGGKGCGDSLVRTNKNFFVEGTLGVDQVAQVALAAKATKPGPTPYLAAGGSESAFKTIGMFQVAGSYDSHLIKLIDFLATERGKQNCQLTGTNVCPKAQSPYGGLTRIGVSRLNSDYIKPAVDALQAEAGRKGFIWCGAVTVEKPDEQTTYGGQIQQLKTGCPGGSAAQIVIPAQDPLTTSREVTECRSQACPWIWTFSDFAHDANVDLTLMQGGWAGVRGLSGGCYYDSDMNPAYNGKCGQLHIAHQQWSAAMGESDWNKNGASGVLGYQLTHIWLKALKDAGSDLTRERFVSALQTYDAYSDLVSAPITFKGSANISHGYDGFSALEAGVGVKATYSQFSDGITTY